MKLLKIISSGFQVGKLKRKCVLQRVADAEVVCAFSFVLKEVVPFLFKSLRFISDLNIHVFGSQLLREVFELLMSNDRGLEPSVHTYS